MRHGVDGTAIPAHSKIYRVLTSKKDPMVHVGEKNYFHVSAFDVEEERFDFYYEIQKTIMKKKFSKFFFDPKMAQNHYFGLKLGKSMTT